MQSITTTERRLSALMLLLAGLLPVVGFLTLPAIGWPDSVQGMAAGEALALVRENPLAFRLGYLAMGLAGVFFIPSAIFIVRAIAADAPRESLLQQVILGFALASGALRSLWYLVSLTTVPVLERLWQGGDSATQASINVFYIAINDLLSTVQEDLGVNIFGGVFLMLVAVAIWQGRAFPRWASAMAGVAGAAFLISSSEFLGISNGSIIPILGPALSSLWMAALGVFVLVRRASPSAQASALVPR